MTIKNINYKKLTSILVSGFILINILGCSKKVKNSYNDYNHYTTENQNTNNLDETKTADLEINDSKYSKEDLETIKTFNEIYLNINEKKDNFKDNCKATFINIVDFIFYEKEINGIKFNDLTKEGKQKVLEIVSKIDDKIESKIPNYKETITDTSKKAFNKASQLIKKGVNNLEEISKEKLGEENYKEIIDAKNEFLNNLKKIKEKGKEILKGGKQKVKEWYEVFKND